MYYNFSSETQTATSQGSRLGLPYALDVEREGESVNTVTAFVDGGVVYGSDEATLKKLRLGELVLKGFRNLCEGFKGFGE
jgi:hypothetical protein